MPLSDDKPEEDGRELAIIAEALYLANLLLVPGICFAILFWLWLKHKDTASPLARQHLKQTTFVSLYGGLMIFTLSAVVIGLGGLEWEWTWVMVIIYFTCIHSTLVMFGMFALAKAMAGQPWRYPLIGPALE